MMTMTASYEQLGLFWDAIPVREKVPRHLRLFERARLKIKGQKVAIVSNPRHPLAGQKVWIKKCQGETIHALSARGITVFISPELRPIQPDEDLLAESRTLRDALSALLAADRDENKKLTEEIKLLMGMMQASCQT